MGFVDAFLPTAKLYYTKKKELGDQNSAELQAIYKDILSAAQRKSEEDMRSLQKQLMEMKIKAAGEPKIKKPLQYIDVVRALQRAPNEEDIMQFGKISGVDVFDDAQYAGAQPMRNWYKQKYGAAKPEDIAPATVDAGKRPHMKEWTEQDIYHNAFELTPQVYWRKIHPERPLATMKEMVDAQDDLKNRYTKKLEETKEAARMKQQDIVNARAERAESRAEASLALHRRSVDLSEKRATQTGETTTADRMRKSLLDGEEKAKNDAIANFDNTIEGVRLAMNPEKKDEYEEKKAEAGRKALEEYQKIYKSLFDTYFPERIPGATGIPEGTKKVNYGKYRMPDGNTAYPINQDQVNRLIKAGGKKF